MESEEKDDTVISVTEKNSPELVETVNDDTEACVVPDAEGNVQIILEKLNDEAIEERKEESPVEEKAEQITGEDGDNNSPKESSDLGKILEQRLDDVVRRNSCEEKTGEKTEDKTESKDVAGESLKRKNEDGVKHTSSSENKKERSADDRHRDHRSKDHKRSSKGNVLQTTHRPDKIHLPRGAMHACSVLSFRVP